jgi:hypothetical protein
VTGLKQHDHFNTTSALRYIPRNVFQTKKKYIYNEVFSVISSVKMKLESNISETEIVSKMLDTNPISK